MYIIALWLAPLPLLKAEEPAPLPVISLEEALAAGLSQAPAALQNQANLGVNQVDYNVTVAKNALSVDLSGNARHNTGSFEQSFAQDKTTVSTRPVENFQTGINLNLPNTTISLTPSHSMVMQRDNTYGQDTKVDLSVNTTLWDGYPGSKVKAALDQARNTLTQGQLTYDSTMNSLASQIKQSYLQLIQLQNDLEAQQASLALKGDAQQKAETMISLNRVSDAAYQQARLAQLSAKADYDTAVNAYQKALKRFNYLVGWPLDKTYQVEFNSDTLAKSGLMATTATAVAAATTATTSSSLDMNALLQKALAERSDLRQLELQAQSLAITKALAIADRAPVIAVNGSLSYNHDWQSSTDSLIGTVGMTVSLPVIDSGANQQQLTKANLQIRQNEEQIAALKQTIALDVEEAVRDLSVTYQKMQINKELADLAVKQHEEDQSMLSRQLVSTTQELTSRVNMILAKSTYEKAGIDYITALWNLEDKLK